MERVLNRVVHLMIVIALLGILYLASYAPFLWAVCTFGEPYHRGPYYRSPAAYRLADWCIVHTPAQSLLLWWAKCFGMGYQTDMQAFYFAEGVADPSERYHFNLGE